MKIGIFVDAYEPYVSGVTTSVKMLKETYEQMGHQVFMVTANLTEFKFVYDEQARIIYMPGIKTGIYDARLTGFYSAKALKIVKSWNLDIIHSHTEFGVGTFARIVRKKFHIPLVHTYHTQYEDYMHYITKGLFDKTSRKLAAKLTKIYGDRTVDSLIVPTLKIEQLFIDKYKINRNIHTIPTGIDTNKFNLTKQIKNKLPDLMNKYKINKSDFIIGVIGRIAKEKSVDVLINNMPELVKDNNNIKLMIIGDGPDVKQLKKLAASLKVSKNVIFTGKVLYDDIAQYYHLIDVLATASQTETQGLTVIEALAASKPVICYNDPSFNETVINDYNGYKFSDNKDFYKAINKLASDKKLYQNMAQNARNSVYRYSKEAYASEVLKVYIEAIQANK